MKITPTDYAAIRNACAAVQAKQPGITPHTYAENNIGKDHDMRFRWDLLRASAFDTSRLYDYANDDHIDTALRRIVTELYS